MAWFCLARHPWIRRAGGIWAVLRQLRLAFLLLRDPRTPSLAKLVVPATCLYLISPINLVPNLIPLVGPIDDLGVVLLGLWLFLKLCPQQLIEEHQARGHGRAPSATTFDRQAPIDGEYRRVA